MKAAICIVTVVLLFFPMLILNFFIAYDMKNVSVTLKYFNPADTEQTSTGPVIRLSLDPVQTIVSLSPRVYCCS